MDVTLNYTGSGYPIAVLIYLSEGSYNSDGTYYSTIKRYAVDFFTAVKNVLTSTPTYTTTGKENNFAVSVRYKNSTSSSTTYSNNAGNMETNVCSGGDAGSTVAAVVKFKNAKKMSVYIQGQNYGFMANIEYTYYIIYSS